jgi:hypothetical protein
MFGFSATIAPSLQSDQCSSVRVLLILVVSPGTARAIEFDFFVARIKQGASPLVFGGHHGHCRILLQAVANLETPTNGNHVGDQHMCDGL